MKLIRRSQSKKGKNGKSQSYGIFWCDFCQKEVEKSLSNGFNQISCGCSSIELRKGEKNKNFKHGESKTKLFGVWHSVKNRIFYKKQKDYKNYGGRGITICPEWTESYIVFRDWALSHGYQEGLEIDRIDPDGNYEPNNCRWVTSKENMRNRKVNKIKSIEQANEIREAYKTGRYSQKEIAGKYNISQQAVCKIINNKIWGND